MKKLLAIFLVLVLMVLAASAAVAEDLSTLSDEELMTLRQDVFDELARRGLESPEEAGEEKTHPALQRLVDFFLYWSGNQYDEMLELCLPEWKEQCENPRMELFKAHMNRTPNSLEIVKTEPGNPEDSVLTVTVISELDRNNGKLPEKYFLQILMEKSADGLWYVDPRSLMPGERTEDLPEAEPTPVPAPVAQIPITIAALESPEGNLFQPPVTKEDYEVLEEMEKLFDRWASDDLDGMLAYCMPEWQLKQESAKTTLFSLLLNRTPRSVTIGGITPAEPEDTFRRVLVDTEMDRHNGEDPAHFLLVIWMVRSGDGLWYFDPGCLENPDRLDLVTQAEPTPDPAALEQFGDSADTVLYYNPTGGEYYHRDPNCKNVNPKFRPLAGSFRFYEINDEPYCHLKRCNVCGAPIRP